MKLLYLDLGMGAAGDMLAGALLDLLDAPARTDFLTRLNGLLPEGVTAAAYTLMAVAESAGDPDDAITFTVDRPFLFVITGDQGLPLFAGIVNQI